jgi:hypothetical protein
MLLQRRYYADVVSVEAMIRSLGLMRDKISSFTEEKVNWQRDGF